MIGTHSAYHMTGGRNGLKVEALLPLVQVRVLALWTTPLCLVCNLNWLDLKVHDAFFYADLLWEEGSCILCFNGSPVPCRTRASCSSFYLVQYVAGNKMALV